jgi:FG-GAP-like repeat/Abnormal spindle-like microcephaly-assoc'd, ASPM-SPD-2-Hydin
MRASVRTACVVIALLALACGGQPLSGQTPNPVPLINNPLSPTSVAPGGPGFTLTVNGTGFVSGATIKWNGAALTTTFVSSSQLTAAVPAGNIATAGTAWITVTNPAPGGGTSLPAFLRIASPVASPSFVSYIQGTTFNYQGISSMITGDFNGDGKLDLAFLGDTNIVGRGGYDSFSVCIELGNGDGSFQGPMCSAVRQPGAGGQQAPGSIVAGDFNGDGKLDLAVSNGQDGTNSVSVFLGNGDGTLQAPVNSQAGTGPITLASGDFNGDGKLDLAVYNLAQGTVTTTFVSVLLGNGDGSFQSPVTYTSGLSIFSLGVGDFNGDGKLDIVLTDESAASPALYFLAGNGDGTFRTPQNVQTILEFDSISSVADLNGDGKLDILLTNPHGIAYLPSTRLLFGKGDGTFQPVVNYSVGTSLSGNACNPAGAVDALSADGSLDLVFCQGNADPAFLVGYQLGNGSGTFQSPVDLTTPNWAFFIPSGIVTGDFRGDGRVDIVASMTQEGVGSNPASLVVFLQGSFPVASATPTELIFTPQAVGSTSTPQTVTVRNTGTLAVSLSSVTIAGLNAADFAQANTCGSNLAGGASCQISVTFTPAAAGNPVATLSVADSAVGSPQTVALVGTGLGPVGSLSPSSVTFTSQYVGTSGLPQTVTLTNTGNGELTIASAATSPSDFGSLNACGGSLAAGASCAIGVFFDPTAGGTRTGTLTITDNAAGSPQTVTLTGSGQDFSVAPSATSSTTVTAGQTASYSIAVVPAGGFAQNVALSCSGGPAGSACAVSPSTIALSGAAAQTAMVTVTTAAHGWLLPFRGGWPRDARYRQTPVILTLAAMILLMVAASQFLRREQNLAWVRVVRFAALVTLGLTLTSCGGGSGSGGGSTNPQAGTYTVTVTGNFSSGATTLSHNAKLTLVVQ